jgi:hypothetical protein
VPQHGGNGAPPPQTKGHRSVRNGASAGQVQKPFEQTAWNIPSWLQSSTQSKGALSVHGVGLPSGDAMDPSGEGFARSHFPDEHLPRPSSAHFSLLEQLTKCDSLPSPFCVEAHPDAIAN